MYLALFMTILVVSENYVMMFIGWSFVGVISYLLISLRNTYSSYEKCFICYIIKSYGDIICYMYGFMLSFSMLSVDFNTIELLVPHIWYFYIKFFSYYVINSCPTAKSAQLSCTVDCCLHGGLYLGINNKVIYKNRTIKI